MLQPDRAQIETFVEVLFKHAGRTGFVSMRSFYEDESRPYRALAAGLSGGLAYIVEAAVGGAVSAANAHRPVVFCPPIAIFSTHPHQAQHKPGEMARSNEVLHRRRQKQRFVNLPRAECLAHALGRI